MSVTKRGKVYYLTFRPFGKLIYLKTAARSKSEAKQIEMSVLIACKSGDYRSLNAVAREACIRLFQNQGLALPVELGGNEPQKELTLWDAVLIFLEYPSIKNCASKGRYGYCLANLVDDFGKDAPIGKLWVPDLRLYQINRTSAGAAAGTVNRDLSTMSKLFNVLIELQLIENNPCRLLKRLSEKSGQRQVYLSFQDVRLIMERCPDWFGPIVLMAYYTGMRRGEILNLTRKQISLSKRVIRLAPEDTKEHDFKRIPIRRELIPILENTLKLSALNSDRVFLFHDKHGVRSLGIETFKNPWPRACEMLEEEELLHKPFPRFHDLRHTWKTNARRSGMDPEIRESILGHWFKEKSVSERYGRISDQELIQAIDAMSFDHGETEIWARVKERKQNVSKTVLKKKKAMLAHDPISMISIS